MTKDENAKKSMDILKESLRKAIKAKIPPHDFIAALWHFTSSLLVNQAISRNDLSALLDELKRETLRTFDIERPL